jgi:hypothetical protein
MTNITDIHGVLSGEKLETKPSTHAKKAEDINKS